MRLTTPELRAILGAQRFHIFGKCRVANEDGTMITVPHFARANWSLDIDNPVSGGTVELVRGNGVDSIAPLVTASTWNRNNADEYSPLLDGNRLVELWAATVTAGVVPAWDDDDGGDYFKVFVGKIDDADPTQGERVIVTVRDLGARLADKPIEVTREYPELPVGALMQAVLDDNPIASGTPTLVVVPDGDWPDWVVRRHELKRGVSVMDALLKYADQAAGAVRYGFDDDGNAALLLYRPDRAKVAPGFTVTVDERLKIEALKQDFTTIRNAVRVTFYDRATGEQRFSLEEIGPSIDKYDRQYAEIAEDQSSNIDSPEEGDAMANGVANDLAYPKASHRARLMFFPIAELHDLGGWEADNFTHDEDQQFGVVSLAHELTPDDGRTTISSHGSVIGQYDRWLRKLKPAGPAPDPPVAPTFSKLYGESAGFGGETGDGYAWIFARMNKSTKYIRLTAEEGDDEATTPMPDLGTNSSCIELYRQDGTTSSAADWESLIPIATRPGRLRRVRAVGVDANGNVSPEYVPDATRAENPQPTPMYGVIENVTLAIGALGIDNYLTIDIGDIEPADTETGNLLCIMRNKIVLETIQLGTNGNRTMTIIDPSITPNAKYTYEIFIWNNGVSGKRFVVNAGIAQTPTDDKPRFINNTPRGIILGGGEQIVLVESTATTPGGTRTGLIASIDGWRTTRTVGITGALLGASLVDTQVGPKTYRLFVDDGVNILAFSDEVYFDGIPIGPGGGVPGGTLAPVLRLIKGVVPGTMPRIPQIIGEWTCDNPAAKTIVIQESDDNGVADDWANVPNTTTASVKEGSVGLGSFAVVKYFRAVTFDKFGVALTFSASVYWQGYQT